MSLFITFEGGEGSGKTTQLEKLSAALKHRQLPILLTREPGGTLLGQEIRKLLLQPRAEKLFPLAELLLYTADRAQHVQEILRPALAQGQIVLCDRYADATWAYQGFGRGFDLQLITQLNQLAADGLQPDLTFLLDIPVEIGLARAKARLLSQQSTEGRFEAEDLVFHQKVREGYLQIARKEPERFRVLDATKDVEALHQEILGEVEKFLSE